MPDGTGLGIAWKIAMDVVPDGGGDEPQGFKEKPQGGPGDMGSAAQRNAEILDQLKNKGASKGG